MMSMPAAEELSAADQAALRDQCSVFVDGHGRMTAADLLAGIPAGTATDHYGDGGAVAELETEIAGLLAKPAAVFLPSGTMAQQSVLRVHADRRRHTTVIFHPMCHLERHEGEAYERLHGLTGRPAGHRPRSRRPSTPCTCRSTRASARSRAAAWPAQPTSSPRCGSGGTAWAARCSPSGRMPRRR